MKVSVEIDFNLTSSVLDTNIVFRTHSIGSGICHGKSAKPVVNDIKVLVFELVAVDTLSTSPIKVGKVSALYNIYRSIKWIKEYDAKNKCVSNLSIHSNNMMFQPLIHSE